MVIRQINVARRVGDLVVTEDQPPISGNRQAPETFQLTFQRVRIPARKTPELGNVLSCLQGKKKLAELALSSA
jgi:hypothetical protein